MNKVSLGNKKNFVTGFSSWSRAIAKKHRLTGQNNLYFNGCGRTHNPDLSLEEMTAAILCKCKPAYGCFSICGGNI
jgi:hypothetical protein